VIPKGVPHVAGRMVPPFVRSSASIGVATTNGIVRAFERRLREVQELGVQIESETIIRVASAFMQRPHVGLGKPGK
jgi:hypothetical protein